MSQFPVTPRFKFPLIPDDAGADQGTPWGKDMRDFMTALDGLMSTPRNVTVSDQPPSGVPNDGDEWIIFTN